MDSWRIEDLESLLLLGAAEDLLEEVLPFLNLPADALPRVRQDILGNPAIENKQEWKEGIKPAYEKEADSLIQKSEVKEAEKRLKGYLYTFDRLIEEIEEAKRMASLAIDNAEGIIKAHQGTMRWYESWEEAYEELSQNAPGESPEEVYLRTKEGNSDEVRERREKNVLLSELGRWSSERERWNQLSRLHEKAFAIRSSLKYKLEVLLSRKGLAEITGGALSAVANSRELEGVKASSAGDSEKLSVHQRRTIKIGRKLIEYKKKHGCLPNSKSDGDLFFQNNKEFLQWAGFDVLRKSETTARTALEETGCIIPKERGRDGADLLGRMQRAIEFAQQHKDANIDYNSKR